MHEFSLCQGLISALYKQPLLKENRRLNRIEVSIGPLSGVEAQLLAHAFPLVIRDTPFSEIELTLVETEIVVQCLGCQKLSSVPINLLICPKCLCEQTQVVQGNECNLTHLFYGETESV
jgi:hydrogenase nickel incorporation protein HypA/HybF